MNSTNSKLFVFFLAFVVVSSCKKEQPQPDASLNCDCAKEVSADFKMGEKFGNQFVELDTIAMPIDYADGNPANYNYLNSVYVYFSANYENATSYEWQVGNNSTVHTEKDFGLYFNDTIGTIQVRLIVHAKPNLICNPYDDGVDTMVKYLTIRNVEPDPLTGFYFGYNTNDPTHFFTIQIDTARIYQNYLPNGFGLGLCLKNLPEGKDWAFIQGNFGSTTSCFTSCDDKIQPYPTNFVLYNEQYGNLDKSTCGIYDKYKNEIRINYYSAPVINSTTLGTPFPKRTFIGKRI